ncbi:MAG: hypothetical protein JSS66_07230 [Armatimonadetes bacterium]|nr:hypothetical protein [Armatimonadota bacterium]
MKKVLFLVFGAVLCMGCQNQSANAAAAKGLAQNWVNDMLPGYEIKGFSCATVDTDSDGYVAVDVMVQKEGGDKHLVQLECPAAGDPLNFQKGSGCKYKQSPMENRW